MWHFKHTWHTQGVLCPQPWKSHVGTPASNLLLSSGHDRQSESSWYSSIHPLRAEKYNPFSRKQNATKGIKGDPNQSQPKCAKSCLSVTQKLPKKLPNKFTDCCTKAAQQVFQKISRSCQEIGLRHSHRNGHKNNHCESSEYDEQCVLYKILAQTLLWHFSALHYLYGDFVFDQAQSPRYCTTNAVITVGLLPNFKQQNSRARKESTP